MRGSVLNGAGSLESMSDRFRSMRKIKCTSEGNQLECDIVENEVPTKCFIDSDGNPKCVPEDEAPRIGGEAYSCMSIGNNVQVCNVKYGEFTYYPPEKQVIDKIDSESTGLSERELRFVRVVERDTQDFVKKQMGQWVIVGLDTCSYCKKAMKLLRENMQGFYYISQLDLVGDQITWVKSRVNDWPGKVPKIFLNNSYFGGYKKLHALMGQ